MDAKEYKELYKSVSKNSTLFKDCVGAFLIGGAICLLGQALTDLYLYLGLSETDAGTVASVSLIFLSAVFTGLGLYDNLARIGGAGTLVPITGFANAMVSPALEYKTESFILGTGVKLFSIAGPVLVFGPAAAVIYGIIYYISTLL